MKRSRAPAAAFKAPASAPSGGFKPVKPKFRPPSLQLSDKESIRSNALVDVYAPDTRKPSAKEQFRSNALVEVDAPDTTKPKQSKAKKPEAKKPEGPVSASTKEPEQKSPLAGTSCTSAQDQDDDSDDGEMYELAPGVEINRRLLERENVIRGPANDPAKPILYDEDDNTETASVVSVASKDNDDNDGEMSDASELSGVTDVSQNATLQDAKQRYSSKKGKHLTQEEMANSPLHVLCIACAKYVHVTYRVGHWRKKHTEVAYSPSKFKENDPKYLLDYWKKARNKERDNKKKLVRVQCRKCRKYITSTCMSSHWHRMHPEEPYPGLKSAAVRTQDCSTGHDPVASAANATKAPSVDKRKAKKPKAKKPEAKKPECQVSASTKEPEQKTPLVATSWTSAQDQDIQDLDQVIQDMDQPGDGFAWMDYTVGSLVWVHCHWLSEGRPCLGPDPGYPLPQSAIYQWWPAIIDTDPDSMELGYCMTGTETDGQRKAMSRYHVAFFDRPGSCVTRAWIRTQDLRPYNKDTIFQASLAPGDPRQMAMRKAETALSMDLQQRRQEFTFAYKPSIKFRDTFDSSEREADDDAAASFDLMSYILDTDKTLASMKFPKDEGPVQEPECKRARIESPMRSNMPGIGKDMGKDIEVMTEEQVVAEMSKMSPRRIRAMLEVAEE